MKNGLVNGIFLEDLLIWQQARYIATQLCMRKQTKQIVFDIHIYLIGEAEANAEEDPVDEEHVDVDGGAAED